MLVVNAVIALRTPTTIFFNTSTDLADTARDGRAGSPPAGAVDSARSKTTLGETGPDLTGVGSAGEGAIGIEDGIAGLDKVGVTWLTVVECIR
jgi:hypothetical protein